MPMVDLTPIAPPKLCRVPQVSIPASRQPPMAQEPPQMPKEMAANAQPVPPELCQVSPIQMPASQFLQEEEGHDGKMLMLKEGLESYWQRIRNRSSPQVSPANSGNELSIGDAGEIEIADESSDEEELEEGSVGEVEEDESGELMFGDESGGEEDWNDGSDESDSEWDEE